VGVRKNFGGEFFVGWFPLNTPFRIDDMNLGAMAKPGCRELFFDRCGERIEFIDGQAADL
jgi:hypothetical protein